MRARRWVWAMKSGRRGMSGLRRRRRASGGGVCASTRSVGSRMRGVWCCLSGIEVSCETDRRLTTLRFRIWYDTTFPLLIESSVEPRLFVTLRLRSSQRRDIYFQNRRGREDFWSSSVLNLNTYMYGAPAGYRKSNGPRSIRSPRMQTDQLIEFTRGLEPSPKRQGYLVIYCMKASAHTISHGKTHRKATTTKPYALQPP